ncbi:MAG: TIGR03067 domain-containing protein [Zavarzinella sp.]|nr:TIGR03067 domain-containing protein [Zavarzinella sp.]
MSRALLSALAVGLLAPAGGRAEDLDQAFAKLRGTWVLIEQAGKKPRHEYKLFVNKANGYRMTGTDGEASDIAMLAGVEGTIRLDASRSPAQIDLVGSKNTLRGLYKLEGERLTFLLGPDGTRPTSFEKGDGTFHIFQREEDKK